MQKRGEDMYDQDEVIDDRGDSWIILFVIRFSLDFFHTLYAHKIVKSKWKPNK